MRFPQVMINEIIHLYIELNVTNFHVNNGNGVANSVVESMH